MDILVILLKTILSYIILIIIMRFMGKREIGQLNLFDLVILLTIVDLLVIGIEQYNERFYLWVLPIILLGIIQKIIAYLLLKIPSFRQIIDGKEIVIINQGVVDIETMKKINYNMNDLNTQLRQKDIRTIEDVQYAILENNGKLSVFLKTDTNLNFPLPLIESGVINKTALDVLGITQQQIDEKIKQKGCKSIKDVYVAYYIKNDIVISKIKKKKQK